MMFLLFNKPSEPVVKTPIIHVLKAFLIFSACVGPAWSNDDNLWKTLASSREQAENLSYSGVLVSHVGAHSQSSRFYHQKASNGEFELLEHLDGEAARWLRLNQDTQSVLPSKKQIFSEKRSASLKPLSHFSSEKAIAYLKEVYSIRAMPDKRIAGYETLVVQLEPKDKYRYEYKFYIDKQHNFLLRSEILSQKGELLEQVGFSEISFDIGVLPNTNLFDAESGWQVTKTEARVLKNNELPYTLPNTLAGFRQLSGFCRSKSKDRQLYQFVFSDGMSTVSVFVKKQDEAKHHSRAVFGHGAMMSKSELQGGYLVTILGEVPETTLNLFLKSMQWKTQ
jgi:sigma-E factor negative regulatory protein RseB